MCVESLWKDLACSRCSARIVLPHFLPLTPLEGAAGGTSQETLKIRRTHPIPEIWKYQWWKEHCPFLFLWDSVFTTSFPTWPHSGPSCSLCPFTPIHRELSHRWLWFPSRKLKLGIWERNRGAISIREWSSENTSVLSPADHCWLPKGEIMEFFSITNEEYSKENFGNVCVSKYKQELSTFSTKTSSSLNTPP